MYKPDFYLHIGMPKTGSTALQSSLELNNNYLKRCGILFSKYHFRGQTKLYFSLDKSDFNNITKSIINEVAKNNYDKTIASSEMFFIILHPIGSFIKKIKRIKKALSDFFNIKIVCYLRRQDLYMESYFNQRVKMLPESLSEMYFFKGLKKTKIYENVFQGDNEVSEFNNFFKTHFYLSEYYKIISIWADVFGKKNIIVRPYEKFQLTKGVIYDFYYNILGLNDEQIGKLKPYKKSNERLSRDIIEFELKTQIYLSENYIEINKLIDNKEDNQTYFTDEERFRLMEYHKKGNEKIAREYLNRSDGILFCEKVEKMQPYSGLTLDKALLITKKLIARKISKKEKQAMLIRLFKKIEGLNKLVVICGINNNNTMVYNVVNMFINTVDIAVADENLTDKHYTIQGTNYKAYKYVELETLSPDIILIAEDIEPGLKILSDLKKLDLKNALIYPCYDYADDSWFSI